MNGLEDAPHYTIKTKFPNEHGRTYCRYQCYIKGGREARDIDVRELVTAVEAIGAKDDAGDHRRGWNE